MAHGILNEHGLGQGHHGVATDDAVFWQPLVSADADFRSNAGTSAGNSGADFSYSNGPFVPAVSGVSPKTGPTSGGTHITITGTGFLAGAKVVIGQGNGAGTGAIAATNVTVVSSVEITAVTGGGAKAELCNLYVTTSGGTSAGNSEDHFIYSQ